MNAVVRLNLDIDPKEFDSSLRLKKAAASLRDLYPKFERIVILGHRGRPKKFDKKLSLKPIVKELSDKARRKIVFLDGSLNDCLKQVLEKKGIFALENTRFFPGEYKNSSALARNYASFGDIFINDDFATAHRSHASTAGIASFLTSLQGPIIKSELEALKKITNKPLKPMTFIVGGIKMSTKMPAIKNLLPKSDYVLLGGGVGNTMLKAQGEDIMNSIYEKGLLSEAKKLAKNSKVKYPEDYRVSKRQILDIGKKTAESYAEIISKSKTVVWAGPVGMFERKAYIKGTETIANAIAEANCFSVAGGGETTSAIISLGLERKFSFLSTGGGAMLEYLAGKKLPALEALRITYR
ncbi:MAG: phosphoglycerate kinase [Candidatus Colwellbacteria bacterium]|jgi:phosphoglycerate kinase|nr:phosphoglycerate kinase [Candidatus Colwellbacteria bacterium]MCK9497267.1 phosphoglycerate kinase [Candidatus Colwellbacteria bacterium]